MFLLSKWYCDCVSDEGNAFVGYWARMRWGPLSIPYAAVLDKPRNRAAREQCVLRSCPPPTLRGDELRWDCRRLGVRARWRDHLPAISRVLLETAAGSITWRCHVPRARARIELAGAGQLSGLGYAELLTLSLKPWRLPFRQLRWGRFLSTEDALTWIEWDGEAPRQWVFHNGVELSGATVQSESVELPGDRGVLELRESVALREGRLAATALRPVPAAFLWLPAGIRKAHEVKWLARGTLTTGTRSSPGWAIHEVVRLR
ncbi:MAG: hypothetical protein GWN99_07855 [Gemmatimonadetes bacterium]|uniref:Uncharacterized protein n=1 Tax=Candidatus Kutchimonas denitrificans TaxID=3056748 RepID=A0AAE4Z9V5_9BACT|nr:hypothetical protein [Gemmatimonadota bacterium]NIR75342.1 hypothetical protein [Candidatus Kutchimonas denitrificans]NIS00974.1 hypothetical protein [Gemmatimonadota bacterium]NIT66601.1 hypothetical protein [Gemmatimonadota bacterium]NIU53171.1 hypothetical protein [Gemmatimonadota bacterium]